MAQLLVLFNLPKRVIASDVGLWLPGQLKSLRSDDHGNGGLSEWMPVYLGKSKNVARRVLEHINLPLEKTTFALKLKARPAMALRAFRFHALELKVENYDIIAPALESALRNRLHPLIGKQ